MPARLIEEHNDIEQESVHHQEEQILAVKRITPLPKFQLFLVLLVQFSEPITAMVIYPFINQFIRDTGITGGDERKIGYYSGIIESMFFITEGLTVFHWGLLSDYYGRRPVLLIGPLGLALSTLGFGLSSTFWPLVVYRALQGVFNGNIGVSRTVMAELTDSTNIGDALAFIPIMWSCGSTIAPAIGGALAVPAKRWPNTLGKIYILQKYPYFLPCFVAAMVAFLSFIVSFMGMKETLHTTPQENKMQNGRENVNGSGEEESLISQSDRRSFDTPAQMSNVHSTDRDSPLPSIRSILTRETLFLCINFGILSFLDLAYLALFPLMLSTPIKLGGLGFDPYVIGVVLGAWGFVNAIVQTILLGPLVRRFGSRIVYIFSISSFFICIITFPAASYFARKADYVDAKVWSVLLLQLTFRMFIFMSYGAIQILIVESSPSNATLGRLNGLVQMTGCATKSFAPAVATSLFSVSLEKRILNGNMVYYILLAVVLIGIQLGRMVPLKR